MDRTRFICGVVEGFYGRPWTRAERFRLMAQLAEGGFNTYFYAPKDDLKHRALWRELYDEEESRGLGELIRGCAGHEIDFIYGLSPGLDLRYASRADRDLLKRRFDQMIGQGCRCFAVLFDDIPGNLHAEDRDHYNSFAVAQAEVANDLFHWLEERGAADRFLFCPTAYCDRMADRQLGGAGYLDILGGSLNPAIDVLWTGPEIVSREITPASIERLAGRIGRAPVLWDNLHANDYDGRRLYCGPYAGRPVALRSRVRGILLNPNNEFPVNFVPLRTLAAYLRAGETSEWDPRRAYLEGLRAWLPQLETVGPAISWEDVVLLGDCFYLPHEEGPEACRLYDLVVRLLGGPPAEWGDGLELFEAFHGRVRTLFERLTELRERELFYAFSRRIWDLKEEMQLLEDWLRARRQDLAASGGYGSGEHLPGTFRGGLTARLQRLLEPDAAGRFWVRRDSLNAKDKP